MPIRTSYTQMLINDKRIDAASGKRFATPNPITGQLQATVTEGVSENVNRTVAAARKPVEGHGPSLSPRSAKATSPRCVG
jgi:aldehyde dehydrogenase (NAD+)